MSKDAITLISLGAGVQSTTLLMMAERGEIEPAPIAAIFADTGWEPQAVYDHLAWLESVCEIPIHRVQLRSIKQHALDKPEGVDMPLFTINEETGKKGILRRQCTQRYKISQLRKKTREIMAEHGVKKANSLLGISLDEIGRMKPSGVKYLTNMYPLIDKRMTRNDCLQWMERHGLPRPPKSACIGCPYHSKQAWIDLKQSSPEEFEDACRFDEAMRHARPGHESFLHRSLIPLRLVDLSTPQDHGQMDFLAECEGICGV